MVKDDHPITHTILFLLLLSVGCLGRSTESAKCQDTGCESHYGGDARCVFVRHGNWSQIGRQFILGTVEKKGLCQSQHKTSEDCCRCFPIRTTTTTTTTSTTTTSTTTSTSHTPPSVCTDLYGRCRAGFNGSGACIDVRQGDLSDIDIDVDPLDGLCGVGSDKCCECFKMKTRGTPIPSATTTITYATLPITSPITTTTTTSTTTTTVVDGGWSSWSHWSSCSKSCGSGVERGTRLCNNPSPKNGGKNCVGSNATTRSCYKTACPVHGTWTLWTHHPCSKTCGGGKEKWTRKCNGPLFGGNPCVGGDTITKECNTQACPPPVDGTWTSWSYKPCSKPCDGGIQKGTRSCNGPFHGGNPCVGPDVTTKECNKQPCPPIDGGWSSWSSWTSCSTTCGPGFERRWRSCNNPPPKNGGKCPGYDMSARNCKKQDCPECRVGWISFNKRCYYFSGSKKNMNWNAAETECGKLYPQAHLVSIASKEEQAFISKNIPRTITFIGVNDILTEGKYVWTDGRPWGFTDWKKDEPNNAGNEDCVELDVWLGEWNDLQCDAKRDILLACSYTPKSCKDGWISFNERCYYFSGNKKNMNWNAAETECTKLHPQAHLVSIGSKEEQAFISKNIPRTITFIGANDIRTEGKYVWTDGQPWGFTDWKKDEPNNAGNEDCVELDVWLGEWNDLQCDAKRDILLACSYTPMPVDGGWSSWSSWSSCSKTCGLGVQRGTRLCNNPSPKNGGKNCAGSHVTTRSCYKTACIVEPGGWSSWSYGPCSKTCDWGTQRGTRLCNNPAPMIGGKNCVGSGVTTRRCKTRNCPPVDGTWTSWSYAPCSKTCGWGTQKGTRSCNGPFHGGNPCVGSNVATRRCKTRDCIPDAGWGSWTSWSSCSKTCGWGYEKRTRLCNNPPPQYGSKNCVGSDYTTRSCKKQDCSECKVGWISFNKRCYYFSGSKKNMNWNTAETECSKLYSQAHLVSIGSKEEQAFISKNIPRTITFIGANDIRTEGKYVWTDGQPWGFTDWKKDEPNNAGNEDCVELNVWLQEWNDIPCDGKRDILLACSYTPSSSK